MGHSMSAYDLIVIVGGETGIAAARFLESPKEGKRSGVAADAPTKAEHGR